MSCLKIKLITCGSIDKPHDRIEPLVRHMRQMESHGVQFVDSGEDVTIVDSIVLTGNPSTIDRCTTPVIIHEIADQSSLVWHELRTFLKNPQVLSLIKAVGLTPWTRYNERVLNYGQGWHFLRMYENNPGLMEQHGFLPMCFLGPRLTQEDVSKIDIGYSIFNHRHVEMVCQPDTTEIDMFRDRTVDVAYAAAVGFPDLTTTWHRHLGIAAVDNLERWNVYVRGYWQEGDQWSSQQWRGLFPTYGETGKLNYKDLHLLMRDTRVFVSPWGTGEACFKDYEAMYAGCVLVKPDTSHCTTWPETYLNNVTYVPCAHDFSDLQEVVDRILENWEDYIYMRVKNRIMLMNARHEFAKHYAGLIVDRYNSARS